MIALARLGPEHAAALLAGQDRELEREISGRRWDRASLTTFLGRAARWRGDGPIREFAALEDGVLIGGGGLALLGAGLDRGQAALTYWVLAAHRGHGHGRALAEQLVDRARDEPRIDELVLRIAPDNAASAAVAGALGARPTGMTERHPADASRSVGRWRLVLRPRDPSARPA